MSLRVSRVAFPVLLQLGPLLLALPQRVNRTLLSLAGLSVCLRMPTLTPRQLCPFCPVLPVMCELGKLARLFCDMAAPPCHMHRPPYPRPNPANAPMVVPLDSSQIGGIPHNSAALNHLSAHVSRVEPTDSTLSSVAQTEQPAAANALKTTAHFLTAATGSCAIVGSAVSHTGTVPNSTDY